MGSIVWPLLFVLLLETPTATPGTAEGRSATVEFLYVGLGDSTLIRSPEGKVALIDAGPHDDVVTLLRARGVRAIDLVIITHRHLDHYGGMDAVLREFPVTEVIENGAEVYDSRIYSRLMEMIRGAGIPISRPTQEPREIALGSVRLTILPHPPLSYFGRRDPGVTENDRSIGVRVQFGDVSFLLTGDSNTLERRWWSDHPAASRLCADATVLKLAHHGSRTGTDAAWLDLVRPQSAVVSMGIDVLQRMGPQSSGWAMPAQEVVQLVRERGLRLQNTALSGTVGYRTDGVSWEVFFERKTPGVRESASVRSHPGRQWLAAGVYLAALAWCLWRWRGAWRGLPPRPFLVFPIGLLVLTLYGGVGASFGIPSLFWHDRPGTQFVAGLSAMGLALLLSRFARATAPLGPDGTESRGPQAVPSADFASGRRPRSRIFGRGDPEAARMRASDRAVGLPLILAALPPALLPELRAERAAPSVGDGLAHLWLPAGLAIGLMAAQACVVSAPRRSIRLGPIGWAVAVVSGLLALVGAAAIAWEAEVSPPAAASICLLLALLGLAAYATHGRAIRRYALGVALIAWVAYANGRDPYKLTFPDLAPYYRPGAAVDIAYHRGMKEGLRGPGRREARVSGRVELVDDVDALNRWRARQRGPGRPTLVVVSVSGGGIVAAVWTAECLERLVDTIPGFARRVRLITGASGGMVGAGHFAASIVAPAAIPPAPRPEPTEPGDGDEGEEDDVEPEAPPEPHPFGDRRPDLADDLSRDCLTPVASHMVLADLPSVLWPGRVPVDRGRALERALERNTRGSLAVPFAELARGEAEGWRPSLVVTPMLVEEGRPLIISNLDLGDFDEIEFFRLFPGAGRFRLSTALRMNAAFPYVTPATSLPTVPPRRVVDAGYFDNYGVSTACAWIEKNQDWLLQNVGGVVLIQIRAYPISTEEAPEDASTYLARGFQWASSPLEGYTAAKRRSMIDRNNGLIARLQDGFQRRTTNQLFFSTVVFECDADAALSWTMTRADRRKLSEAMDSGENRLALDRVQLLLRAKYRGIGNIKPAPGDRPEPTGAAPPGPPPLGEAIRPRDAGPGPGGPP